MTTPSHHLGLVGARVVQTAEVLLSARAVRDVLSARALGVMHGPAGSGKTFTARLVLDELAVAQAWVQFPSRPTMLHVARRLYRELTGADSGRANRFDLSEELIALLAVASGCWLLMRRSGSTASASSICATCMTIPGRGSRCCWSVVMGAGGCSRASRCSARGSTGGCGSRRCAYRRCCR